MAKAVGVGTKELFKMMEQGQLVSSEVLPKFAKQLKIAVREGDALGEGLKTSRVAMQRFGTSFKLNILDSFDAGLESGMSEFFNSLTEITTNSAPLVKTFGAVVGKFIDLLSVGMLAVSQLFRPMSALLWDLTDGADEAGSSIGFLTKAFNTLLATVLVPFVYLEKMNDWLEDAPDGLRQVLRFLLVIVNTLVGGFLLGLLKGGNAISRITSGVGGIVTAFNKLKWVATGVLGMISRHPVIAALLSVGYLYDKLTAESVSNQSDRITNATKDQSWFTRAIAQADLYNTQLLSVVPGMFGLKTPDVAADYEKKYGATTNHITIQVHDTEQAAKALKPYLSGQIDERMTFHALTSTNTGAGG